MNFIKKLLDSEYKELCRFEKLAEEIEKLEPVMQALKDEDFKDKTLEFKAMLEDGKTLEDIVKYFWANHHIVVWRELTKKFEEFKRWEASEVLEYFKTNTMKWEFVIIF